MSSSNGWFTTKKRGRDDEEIERAQQEAKERIRKKRGLLRPATTKAKNKKNNNNNAGRGSTAGAGSSGRSKKKVAPPPKKKKIKNDYEDDGFVVNSSEEEDSFDESDDELSEASVSPPRSKRASTAASRSRPAAAPIKRVSNDSGDDDSYSSSEDEPLHVDDDDDDDSISTSNSRSSSSDDDLDFSKSTGHSSRVAPHMRRNKTTTVKRAKKAVGTKRGRMSKSLSNDNSSSKRTKQQRGFTSSVLETATTKPSSSSRSSGVAAAASSTKNDDDNDEMSASSDVDIFNRKKKEPRILAIESSDDDDDSSKKKPSAQTTNNNNKVDLTLEEDDDSDDDDAAAHAPVPAKPNKGRLKKKGQKKPVAAAAAAAAAAASSTKSEETTSRFFNNNSDKKTKANGDAEDGSSSSSHEEGDTPVGHHRRKQGAAKAASRKRVVAEPDDDEDDHGDGTGVLHDDDDGFDDDQMAIAIALSESAAEASQNKKDNTKRHALQDSSDEEEKVIDLLDDENDDDEEDGDDDEEGQEAFVEDDPDAKTADIILSTANQLSAQILQTMTQWIAGNWKTDKDKDDEEESNTKSNVPVGMIVDGALAMGDMAGGGDDDNDNDDNRSSDWISQETMREICPNVTLAKYQLIGVNWMALLHGMKVQVGSSLAEEAAKAAAASSKSKKTKYTNVNGILADEMGLGKTAQTICFLAWLKHTREKDGKHASILDDGDEDEVMVDSDNDDIPTRHHGSSKPGGSADDAPPLSIVVVPSSVIDNWKREFEKFAPHMSVVKYHGSMAEREEIQENLRRRLLAKRAGPTFVKRKKDSDLDTSDEEDNGEADTQQQNDGPVDIILAPITYFQKEKSDDRTFLRKLTYEYLVVDEAHVLKNAAGNRYKNLDRFRTAHRLLLTGTPVQNSPSELICLLSFATRLFSRSGGGQSYDDDGNENDGGESMLKHFVEAHRMENGNSTSGDGGYAAAYKKLKQLFSPFVLRRRKADVLSQIMPPKERQVDFVALDPASRTIYDSILENHIKNKQKSGSGKDHVFTQLRKASHHPLLLRTRYTSVAEKEHLNHYFYQYGAFKGSAVSLPKVSEEVDKFNDFDIHLTAMELIGENPCRRSELDRYVLNEDDLFSSPKFVRLRALLPQLVADGHRILIFSVWTSCLDLLTCLMDLLNLPYLRMQGDTPVQERQGLIDTFNRDTSIPVFLLSTNACGLGINLTAADTCIMHDISFNPFNDLQAEDRCHRIGQKRPVTVIKLVTEGTVDKDIYEMQERKAKMNAAIMENNNNSSSSSSSNPSSPSSSSTEWNNQEVQRNVMRNAVDRYLKSPPAASQEATAADSSDNNNNNSKENKANVMEAAVGSGGGGGGKPSPSPSDKTDSTNV